MTDAVPLCPKCSETPLPVGDPWCIGCMEQRVQERMAPPIAADSASQEVLIPAVGTPSQAQTPVRDAQRGRSETPKTVARPSLLRKLNNGGKLAVLQATRQRAEANNVSLTQQAAADGILSGTLSKLCKKVAELEANKDKKSMHAGRPCKVVESLDALVKTFVNDTKSHIVDHLVEKSVGFMSDRKQTPSTGECARASDSASCAAPRKKRLFCRKMSTRL